MIRFPGGHAPIPAELADTGMSGTKQIRPAKSPPALGLVPTRRLEELHDEMGALACLEPEGQLRDYMLLVEMQCAAALTGRMNK